MDTSYDKNDANGRYKLKASDGIMKLETKLSMATLTTADRRVEEELIAKVQTMDSFLVLFTTPYCNDSR